MIVSNVESDLTEEIAFPYHLLHTFAYAYHMHQRKVVSDNEWTGWLHRMLSYFEQGKIREYWESGLQLEKWFALCIDCSSILVTIIHHITE